MFIGNKKCRIYAACGVSQTPNILKKTEGKTLIFVTHEEQEAVWLKADKTLKFMKDHLIK